MKPSQLDAIEAWAIAALKGTAQHKALRAKLDKTRPPTPFAHFKLDPLERRIAELAWAVERSLAVAQLARTRSGGPGLTVELLRATLHDAAVDAALSLKRALRRHALITVGDGGAPAAVDVVRLAPGLAARLDGAAEPDALWPGIARLVPGGRGDVPVRVTVVLDDLDPRIATILTLDGCGRRDAHDLAAGLARRAGRGVLLIDGELAAAAPSPWLLAQCARREADLDGDALLVCQAAALGENWRALLVPAADAEAARAGQGAVPLIVLADSGHTRDPLPAPFLVRRLSLHAPAVATAPSASASEPAVEPKTLPIDDGLDHVRQMAIRDAERALGIYRPTAPPPSKPLASPPPNALAARTATAPPTPPPPATSSAPAATSSAPPANANQPPPSAQENARAQLKQAQAEPPSPRVAPDERKGELPVDREAARALMMERRAAAKAEKEAQARNAARAAAASEIPRAPRRPRPRRRQRRKTRPPPPRWHRSQRRHCLPTARRSRSPPSPRSKIWCAPAAPAPAPRSASRSSASFAASSTPPSWPRCAPTPPARIPACAPPPSRRWRRCSAPTGTSRAPSPSRSRRRPATTKIADHPADGDARAAAARVARAPGSVFARAGSRR